MTDSEYGRIAYEAAASATGCTQPWAEANQDKWIAAAQAVRSFKSSRDYALEHMPAEERGALTRMFDAMAAKVYGKYLEGYSGFETASEGWLNKLLHNHLPKGDPVDVANFCAFLYSNGQSTTAPTQNHGAYLIYYDDKDRPPEIFMGDGSEEAAKKRYEDISVSWNAHLFGLINSNSRDAVAHAPSLKDDRGVVIKAGDTLIVPEEFGNHLAEVVVYADGALGLKGLEMYVSELSSCEVAHPDTLRLSFVLASMSFIQTTKVDAGGSAYQLMVQDEDEDYIPISGSDVFFSNARDAIDAAMRASQDGPATFDGHDNEGFPGGCARMGCPGGEACTNKQEKSSGQHD